MAPSNRDPVRVGILQGYVLDVYSARKLGLRSTGNTGGVHNLTIQPGDQDLAGLLRQMGAGLSAGWWRSPTTWTATETSAPARF